MIGHAAVLRHHQLFIVGGFGGPSGNSYLGDVWSFNFATHSWEELDPDGPQPAARSQHTMVALNDTIFIQNFTGEQNQESDHQNDDDRIIQIDFNNRHQDSKLSCSI